MIYLTRRGTILRSGVLCGMFMALTLPTEAARAVRAERVAKRSGCDLLLEPRSTSPLPPGMLPGRPSSSTVWSGWRVL